MGKVKITQEQADEIEYLLEDGGNKKAIVLIKVYDWFHKSTIINSIELDTLIHALYIGYEIKPQFKNGDWIIGFNNNIIQLTKYIIHPDKNENWAGKMWEKNRKCWNSIAFKESGIKRHATSEEVKSLKQSAFWNSNNRDVWELKKGDFLNHLGIAHVVDSYDLETDLVTFGEDLSGGRVTYEKDYVRDHFEVVCFAHDRKDIKND